MSQRRQAILLLLPTLALGYDRFEQHRNRPGGKASQKVAARAHGLTKSLLLSGLGIERRRLRLSSDRFINPVTSVLKKRRQYEHERYLSRDFPRQ